jgi:hypothetical protein
VLVVGATGGVGSLAVQLASRGGATVVAPALPEDEDYLRDLGVSELLPREADLAAAARECYADGFDAVLDLVNYGPGVPATLVKDGGRVASPTGAAGEGPGRTTIMAAPTSENLQRLAGLLADGALRVPVHATYELEQAPDALTALGTTHTRGKLAVRIGRSRRDRVRLPFFLSSPTVSRPGNCVGRVDQLGRRTRHGSIRHLRQKGAGDRARRSRCSTLQRERHRVVAGSNRTSVGRGRWRRRS